MNIPDLIKTEKAFKPKQTLGDLLEAILFVGFMGQYTSLIGCNNRRMGLHKRELVFILVGLGIFPVGSDAGKGSG